MNMISATNVRECFQCHRASVHNGIKETNSNGSEREPPFVNLSSSFDDHYQKVNTNSEQRDHTTVEVNFR